MNVTMNMSNYEVEDEVTEIEYDDEILYAGWNPEVDSVVEQLQLVSTSEQDAIPDDLTTVAAELFLRKMYSYQR